MHSFQGPDGTSFSFNSDLSGLVVIHTCNHVLEVSGTDLLHFIAEYVRSERIGAVSDASVDEVLGLPQPKVFPANSPSATAG